MKSVKVIERNIFREIFAVDIESCYSDLFTLLLSSDRQVQFFLTLVVYSISDYSETYDGQKDVCQVAF